MFCAEWRNFLGEYNLTDKSCEETAMPTLHSEILDMLNFLLRYAVCAVNYTI